MSASAGKAIPRLMGDYNANTTYYIYDVVHYGVSSYILKVAESTGNLPTNASYWQVYAEGISNISPEALGIGYGISSDSGSARTATLSNYNLTPNGIVAVTFGADVPANATLNINSQGAKPIYFRGSAIVANVIKGGDTVTFAYDGTHYDVLCIDGGAGHKILNSAGTELTQRDALQFTDGLEATDDSTNQKTQVKMNLPTISLADWNAMSTAEQTAYKASHYRFGIELPDSQGVINAEFMKLLWENPNTTQAFASQTITLNSADYDMLLFITKYSNAVNNQCSSVIIEKGYGGYITIADMSSASYSVLRGITRNSDTSYTFTDALVGNTSTADNSRCIPVAVYGIKKTIQLKINAIATELSTRADHCFLDDEVTTVEDALNNANIIDQTPGNSVTLNFTVAGAQVQASQGFRIGISFPFITKNTNYSISDMNITLANVGATTVNSYGITKTKNTISFITTYNTTSANSVCFASGSFTITFA